MYTARYYHFVIIHTYMIVPCRAWCHEAGAGRGMQSGARGERWTNTRATHTLVIIKKLTTRANHNSLRRDCHMGDAHRCARCALCTHAALVRRSPHRRAAPLCAQANVEWRRDGLCCQR